MSIGRIYSKYTLRESLQYYVWFPLKLITLTRICIENTKYRVRTQNVTSGTFTVKPGWSRETHCPHYLKESGNDNTEQWI